MPGGIYDSSLTRVQPVFSQLASADPSGQKWLARLISMGTRAGLVGLPDHDNGWPGKLLRGPCFEYPCAAPADYLKSLIASPERLQWPVISGQRKKYSEVTERCRHKLLSGDAGVQATAMNKLEQGKRGRAWWILEGETKVDCAIFASGVTLFIEGKRTEPHLTAGVDWDKDRHQVIRNLDCLRALPDRKDSYFVLLAVDEANPDVLSEAQALDFDYTTAERSLPHLSSQCAKELFDAHYLGFVTWQRIAGAFNLNLPSTREEAGHI